MCGYLTEVSCCTRYEHNHRLSVYGTLDRTDIQRTLHSKSCLPLLAAHAVLSHPRCTSVPKVSQKVKNGTPKRGESQAPDARYPLELAVVQLAADRSSGFGHLRILDEPHATYRFLDTLPIIQMK